MLWPLAGRTGYTSEMTERDEKFLADFFRKVGDAPLPSYDERYVEIYENPALAEHDPVDLLARAITWTPESVQLLSGYRGTGKSTELRRLQKRLQEDDYLVFLYDVEEWLNLSAPVDVSDFLYLPISNEDARWLAEIARSHDIALRDLKALPGLTRLLDTHLVLCYRNGGEWYDVHPLISERVQEQAKQR